METVPRHLDYEPRVRLTGQAETTWGCYASAL